LIGGTQLSPTHDFGLSIKVANSIITSKIMQTSDTVIRNSCERFKHGGQKQRSRPTSLNGLRSTDLVEVT
jgi:hypothetical protein